MATTETGVVELDTGQILTVRGAAAAIIEAVDSPFMEIDDQFDPVRRDHLEAASASLAEALSGLAPGGTWRGRMSPSEQQALRDAVGAVEVMLTPPRSERLRSLDYHATDDELQQLSDALDGIPPVNREDLAASDFRFGGSDRALRDRTPYDELLRAAQDVLGDTPEPDFDRALVVDQTFPPRGAACSDRDRALVDVFSHAARLSSARGSIRHDVADALPDTVEATLDSTRDCYTEMDTRRITTAAQRTALAVRNGEVFAENHALGAVEMIAWAESTRERERRIGIR